MSKDRKGQIVVDDAVEYMKFFDIPRGVQAVIRLDGEKAILVVVNPDDGRKPYIIQNDDGFDEIVGLLGNSDE